MIEYLLIDRNLIRILDFLLLRMRTSKNRSSLNTSTTNNESSFRWQQCSQCLKSIPFTADNHQCLDELNGLFLENNRARLILQEHKSGLSKERKISEFEFSFYCRLFQRFNITFIYTHRSRIYIARDYASSWRYSSK